MHNTLYQPISTKSKDLSISEQEIHWIKSNQPPNPKEEEVGTVELRSPFSKVTLVRNFSSTRKQVFQY